MYYTLPKHSTTTRKIFNAHNSWDRQPRNTTAPAQPNPHQGQQSTGVTANVQGIDKNEQGLDHYGSTGTRVSGEGGIRTTRHEGGKASLSYTLLLLLCAVPPNLLSKGIRAVATLMECEEAGRSAETIVAAVMRN